MQKNGSRKGVSENKQDEKVAHKWERRGLDPASQIQESLEHHEERPYPHLPAHPFDTVTPFETQASVYTISLS